MSTNEKVALFNGSNWEDLNRHIALAKLQFLWDSDYSMDAPGGTNRVPNEEARCAFLASKFDGPALDWVQAQTAQNFSIFRTWYGFITLVRNAFGVDDDNIKVLCQGKLDNLRFGQDVPIFFSEIERYFTAIGITGDDTKITIVMQKLPQTVKHMLADQGLQFHNYDTMKKRLLTRWAMQASLHTTTSRNPSHGKVKCENCGKKGHTASVCRKPKN
jgi:hypothetical protein